jgi:hypothetical protein
MALASKMPVKDLVVEPLAEELADELAPDRTYCLADTHLPGTFLRPCCRQVHKVNAG